MALPEMSDVPERELLEQLLAKWGPVACQMSALPDAWFSLALEDDAVAACLGCAVRTECGEYAVAADERYGVWGGLTEADRRAIRQMVRRPS
mgnify:CR=1 FL=1